MLARKEERNPQHSNLHQFIQRRDINNKIIYRPQSDPKRKIHCWATPQGKVKFSLWKQEMKFGNSATPIQAIARSNETKSSWSKWTHYNYRNLFWCAFDWWLWSKCEWIEMFQFMRFFGFVRTRDYVKMYRNGFGQIFHLLKYKS